MFAVERLHYSVEFLRSTKNFVVNVLRDGQQRLAGLFARRYHDAEGDKLETVPVRSSETGAAILTDALSYLDCEVVEIHEAGDHLVVIGAVVDAGILNDGMPLTAMAGPHYQRTAPRP